jgi:serine protease Do
MRASSSNAGAIVRRRPVQLSVTLLLALTVMAGSAPMNVASAQSVLQSLYNDNLTKDERIDIQYQLMWAGNYNSILDGDIGEKTINGIKDFQVSLGLAPNGLVDAYLLNELRRAAERARVTSRYTMTFDSQSGTEIGIPVEFVGNGVSTSRGTRWRHQDKEKLEIETIRIAEFGRTLEDILLDLKKKHGGAIKYIASKPNFIVVSGERNSKKFYVRFHEMSGDIRGFSVSYNADYSSTVDRIVVAMANSFDPWQLPPLTPKAPIPIQPKVPPLENGRQESAPVVAGVTPQVTPPSLAQTPTAVPNSSTESAAVAPATTPPPSPPPAPTTAAQPVAIGPQLASTGTGFAIAANWLLTNAHVVEGCKRVAAKSVGDSGRVIADETNDLALLEFPANSFVSPLAFSGKQLALGESVVALGYPLRSILAESLNVTVGNVSSLAGPGNDSRYLQMTAAVQHGNSGGPLLGLNGAIIGVVSAQLRTAKVVEETGDIPQSVNFAIKQQAARSFIESNGIEIKVTAAGDEEKTVTKIAELAKKAVFPIDCFK